MTIPILTLVGRPNVGKSTLFNTLTQTRDAIVADMPGVTRDRQYGIGKLGEKEYLVVDTGGITVSSQDDLQGQVETQIQQAILEADKILFVLDAKVGLVAADWEIAKRLRPFQKKTIVVVNKVDQENMTNPEFFELGFPVLFEISARAKQGVLLMMDVVLKEFPDAEPKPAAGEDESIAIAIVGRPNVGKSTLVNRLLGEDRVLVLDEPGTTRDSIYIPFERRGEKYTLIDTAGMRRRARIDETLEKFSVAKSLLAIERATVVLFVMDARTGITDQDLRLLGLIVQLGKALIIGVNKWDGMSESSRTRIKDEIDRRLPFVAFARRYWISALHGTGVGQLYKAIHEAYDSATRDLSTNELTRVLEKAVENYQPPMVHHYPVRMKYAHLGGHNPMIIVIHGKRVSSLPPSYQRYLAAYFRKTLRLVGVPLQLQFKQDANPYVD